MNDQDQTTFDTRIAEWFENDPNEAPDQALQVVLAAFPSIKQRHATRLPWRTFDMNTALKFALAAAAVIAVVLGGTSLLGPHATGPGGVVTSPSASPSGTPSPSPATSLSPSPSRAAEAPIDTSAWTTYTSERYGFSIGHPADWTEVPATRAWTFEADADDPLAPGADSFFTPVGGGVRVSTWSVAWDPGTTLDPAQTVEAWLDGEAWVEEYCQKAGNAPCAGIHDRAVPLCLERRDCHPGLLVPFNDDVQAFFSGGIYDADKMIVVAIRWGESQPAVAPYGGSQRLLEAFLSTMSVWPASVPLEERIEREVPTPPAS